MDTFGAVLLIASPGVCNKANDDLIFFYPTYEPVEAGFRYFTAKSETQWTDWSGPNRLTGPEISGRDASKHDRRCWTDKGILSFTAKTPAGGFIILDVEAR